MDARPTLHAFNGLAEGYDRFRPRYPRAIVEVILADLPAPARAVDIGCGTGISARMLRDAGADVVGVDPNADMLGVAREAHAGVDRLAFRQGTAEATTLADASADLVLAAQAFHWFDPERALAEFHRVLRPRGRVALLWNLRRTTEGFAREYEEIVVRDGGAIDPTSRNARRALDAPLHASSIFRDVRVHLVPNPQELDEEAVLGRALSASYFPRTEPERSDRLAALREAFRRHAHDGKVTLEQDARLTVATRA